MNQGVEAKRKPWLFRYAVVYALVVLASWASVRWLGRTKNRNLYGTPAVDSVQRYDAEVQKRVQGLWDRIETALRKQNAAYVKDFGPPATDQEIADLEKCLGYVLPGDLKASLKVHNGTGQFVSEHELYGTAEVCRHWNEYIEILGGRVTGPLSPHPSEMEMLEWHPAWIPVGGWDAFEMIVNAETGSVGFWTGYEAQRETYSWSRWLEIVAERLESGYFKPIGEGIWMWTNESDYWTPGSEEPAE